jgi:hypothetical protein
MLTVQMRKSVVAAAVFWQQRYGYSRIEAAANDRLELLSRMLNHLGDDDLVSVDEELFKFLGVK